MQNKEERVENRNIPWVPFYSWKMKGWNMFSWFIRLIWFDSIPFDSRGHRSERCTGSLALHFMRAKKVSERTFKEPEHSVCTSTLVPISWPMIQFKVWEHEGHQRLTIFWWGLFTLDALWYYIRTCTRFPSFHCMYDEDFYHCMMRN